MTREDETLQFAEGHQDLHGLEEEEGLSGGRPIPRIRHMSWRRTWLPVFTFSLPIMSPSIGPTPQCIRLQDHGFGVRQLGL